MYNDNPMQRQVNELTQQLNQQADYCASMGYACCSLLWRVSQQEQAVEAMLAKVTHSHRQYMMNICSRYSPM